MNKVLAVKSMDDYMCDMVTRFGFKLAREEYAITLAAPADMGKGYIQLIQVSDDIDIGVIDLTLTKPLISYYEDYDNTCEATYCFSGHIVYSETGTQKASLEKNTIGIYTNHASRGMMMIPSDERVVAVSVSPKKQFLHQLPHYEQCQSGAPAYAGLLPRLATPRKADIKTHNYFSRILDNNMEQGLKNTCLDAWGKIVLADLWQEHVMFPLKGHVSTIISDFERSALHQAREIIMHNYQTPPTTNELARMAGLNTHKLKTGFRELFGMSVYECVRFDRMKNARHMLEDSDLSISQIAGLVGYVNTSHFARAFRNEFGKNPRDFRFGV